MAIFSYYFIALRERNLPLPPLEGNSVKSFRGRGQGKGTKWVVSLSTQGSPIKGYAGGETLCGRGSGGVGIGDLECMPARCPVPAGPSQAEPAALNPLLQAIHVTLNCWVPFVFLIGKQRSTKYTPLHYPLRGS